MEERIIDREREIKIKRKAGETDAVEEGAELSEGEEGLEDEVVIELPEGEEYDEDLVGLTPSQLKAELARRERAAEEARAERDRLLQEGERLLKENKYNEAAPFFVQARVFDPESDRARAGLWASRTHGYTEIEPLLTLEVADELEGSEADKRVLCERMGAPLREARDACLAEERAIAPAVEGKQAERREAFRVNRKYYLVRFCIVFAVMALLIVGCAVSAGFIVRTKSMTPIILTGAFGGGALVVFGVLMLFARKLFVANRLCARNERLSATEEGDKLVQLRTKLYVLNVILEEQVE